MYILCYIRRSSSSSPPNDELHHLGSAFATGPSHVVSVAHNLPPRVAGTDVKYLLMRSACVDNQGRLSYAGPRVEIELVNTGSTADWARFKRTDVKQFEAWLPLCPKEQLPHRDGNSADQLFLYHTPLGLLVNAPGSVGIYRERVELIGFKGDEGLEVTRFSQGKMRGSSGGPIVDGQGRVLAFLIESEDDTPCSLPLTSGMPSGAVSDQGSDSSKSCVTKKHNMAQVKRGKLRDTVEQITTVIVELAKTGYSSYCNALTI